MADKPTLFKNLACLSLCLFMFFLASIFVSETYFNRIINEQIQELALLKSIHYQDWGSLAAPSPVIHKFQPYTYDSNGNSTLFNESLKYQYTYKYDKFTFTQGNTGNIRYLNSWKRVSLQNNNSSIEDVKINVFNVEAQKVYNYDYYAPDIRRFALTYNIVYDMLAKEFVPVFYGQYMYEYIFKNRQMVDARIFNPMKMSKDQADKIYNHERYGLNQAEKLSKWLKLSDLIDDGTYYTSELYFDIIRQLGLNQAQILYISGSKSSLRGLFLAIRGALTAKISQIDGDFCDGDDDFCSNQRLVAAQLSIGILTQQSIFPTTIINKSINKLNTTIFDTIQYRVFCAQRPDIKNCSGDSDSDSLGFFGKNILSNYTQVAYIFKNLDNPTAIQTTYDIPDAGQAMIQYVKFLYTKSFNLPLNKSMGLTQNKQIIQSQQSQDKYIIQSSNMQENINVQAFKRSFTNYNHIQLIMDRFEQLLYVQLYSKAFYNKYINITTQPKCEDYYTGDYEANKDDCKILPLNNLSDIRVYMNTYLGVDSQLFTNQTTISNELIYDFFHNDKSLFAKQTNQIAADISLQYNCTSKISCRKQQLFYKQWKDGSVMNNLPIKYFTNASQSIINWDTQKLLNGIQPQLYKFITVSPQLDPNQILNSNTGIYSLFNLMKIYSNPNANTFTALLNSDLLYYLQSVVMEIQFKGIYLQQTSNQFFNTHKSQIINQKRTMNPQLGGAPWLSPDISVLKLQNNPTTFNNINSGIFDSQKLRSISMIQDNIYSSSVYQTYKSQWEDVSITYTSDKKIKGTDLFGFQTKIQQHDSIIGYFDMIYQGQSLSYKDIAVWKYENKQDIDAYRFGLGEGSKKFDVNVEQLSNKTIQINSDTYFIVQPNTGLTLQMYIKYTVYSKPFYVQYLQRNNNTSIYPLYQGEVYYVNSNTGKIVQINKDKHTLNVLFLMGIILSSLFIVVFVVMLVMYRKARRSNLFRDQNKSLMSNQISSGVGSQIQQ